jgi:HTH-type transcriptional regulator/antitoxin HigA
MQALIDFSVDPGCEHPAAVRRAFRRLEKIFQAEEGTPPADKRDVLVSLIEAYENKHCDFGPVVPVEAINVELARAAGRVVFPPRSSGPSRASSSNVIGRRARRIGASTSFLRPWSLL